MKVVYEEGELQMQMTNLKRNQTYAKSRKIQSLLPIKACRVMKVAHEYGELRMLTTCLNRNQKFARLWSTQQLQNLPIIEKYKVIIVKYDEDEICSLMNSSRLKIRRFHHLPLVKEWNVMKVEHEDDLRARTKRRN